jgi:hypothetical protein
MGRKVKTSIMVDEGLWEIFKAKASSRRGPKGVSGAVEEVLEEELGERVVAEALERMGSGAPTGLEVKPVRPRIATSAGEVISELRDRAV